MPTKKTTKKQNQNGNDVVHLFLASSIGLLLFIVAAQMILTRAIWEEVVELRMMMTDKIDEVDGEDNFMLEEGLKEVVTPRETDAFTIYLPEPFKFAGYEYGSDGNDVYTITRDNLEAYIYKGDAPSPDFLWIEDGDGNLTMPDYAYEDHVGMQRPNDGWRLIGVDRIGPTGVEYEVLYWDSSLKPSPEAQISQLQNAITSVVFK